MSHVVVAYVPVLHDGYRRFLERHGRGRPLHLIGPELYADYRPLAKDIRALDPALAARAIDAWGICSSVDVLDEAAARELALESPSITLPAEDVSYQVVERFFARCPVQYDSAFLRWDKSKTVQLLEPDVRSASEIEALSDLTDRAEAEAGRSLDWWRQVGAAIRFADGEIHSAGNQHLPHPLSPYAAGDPRANFYKGVHLELSTAQHAEAALIARAAASGHSTDGAVMYVTDFPCPPCAKLIAAAGVARVYYREGYAVLDGLQVLEDGGVDVVHVDAAAVA